MAIKYALAQCRYTFPVLASIVDNTLTALTDITLYCPETYKEWISCEATLTADDIVTVTGSSVASRRIDLGLGGGTKTSQTGVSGVWNSTAENISIIHTGDFLARFIADWPSASGGTSKSCQVSVLTDQTGGTTLGMVNVCVTLDLVYTYQCGDTTITGVASTDVVTTAVAHSLSVGDWVYIDGLTGGAGLTDGTYEVASVPTSTTLTLTGVNFTTDISAGTLHFSPVRVKSIPMVLNAPIGALATSKPGTANHVIPVMSTDDSGECPEREKTFRQLSIEVLANTCTTGTTDHTWSMEIGSAGAITSGNYEAALSTSRFIRYCTSPSFLASMDVSVTNDWYFWGSAAFFNHSVTTLWVTYEYNAKTSIAMRVDQYVPVNPATHIGGVGGPPSCPATIWIPEDNITTKQIAFVACWFSVSLMSTLNLRLGGSGAYTSYTDNGNVFAGGCCAAIRGDGSHTLSRGRNDLLFHIYRGSSGGTGLTGFWYVSYICDVPADGVEVATKSIRLPVASLNNRATAPEHGVTFTPAAIPESNSWFMPNWAFQMVLISSSITGLNAAITGIGNDARDIGAIVAVPDGEAGWGLVCLSRPLMWPWDNYKTGIPASFDAAADPSVSCSVWTVAGGVFLATTFNTSCYSVYTYHTMTWPVAGDVIDSNGGLVRISLHRAHHRDMTGITGLASTDVITTPTPHRVTAGQTVLVSGLTGGAGLADGPYVVATTPTSTTLTLTSGTFTTDISAGTLTLPNPDGGELLRSATRVGDGAYSFDWFDNTEPVYVDMFEDGTHLCRTAPALAGT